MNEKKASEFETKIRAEIHNLSLMSNQEERRTYLQTLLDELLPIIQAEDPTIAVDFKKQIRLAYNRNMNTTNIDIDGSHGMRIDDDASGVRIKVKYNDMGKGVEYFKDLQNDYINNKLDLVLIDMLTWFYKKEIFDYRSSTLPDIYQTFAMNSKPEKKTDKGDKVVD